MSYTPTPQQAGALDVIRAALDSTGRPPTMKELATGLGLNSHSSARRLVVELVAKGHCKQLQGRRRSLTIVDASVCPHCGERL